MVTIIKNQLLKHLSRYTKNLSPEQISLSALRGSGELQDLTLDEELLTDLLELPSWLKLTSAKCNRATFRIQWTKLKTVPIVLNLDEVRIALEVCQEPRASNPNAAGAMPIPGQYSYIHKVIDGISVAVNQVQIDFNCDAFTSSVQLMRVTVESRLPDGRKGDLRLTRLKSPDTGQLLIFKELEWQSARIEAKAHGPSAANLPPLRLLLGNTHCRIVIKKRISDCAILGSRLVFRPEPIALALTDGQLRAALCCAAALPVQLGKATPPKAQQPKPQDTSESTAQSHAQNSDKDILSRLFNKHDVKETSFHLLAPRIDLHLCDDPGLGRSDMPLLSNGGALQLTLVSMQADLFPYHRANADRLHWRGYRESATPHSQWLSQALSSFATSLLEALDPRPVMSSNKASSNPVKSETTHSNGLSHKSSSSQQSASNAPSNNTTTSQASPTRTKILQQFGQLMTSCIVLRIDDFTVFKVATGSKSREPPRPFICAEKTTMPGDAGLLHAEVTFFYHPSNSNFPVPAPKMYVQLSPVRINVDVPTIIWLGAIGPHIGRALEDSEEDNEIPYFDVKAEAIMPKVVLEAGSEHVSQQRDRPKELQICTARATVTNIRESRKTNAPGSRAELASLISSLRRSAPSNGQFPCSTEDIDAINEQFVLHSNNLDDIDRGTEVSPEMLWRDNRNIWWLRVEPLWADFCGARATNNKPAPLLDATPLTAWVCFEGGFSRIYAIAKTAGLAGLQLNHYQLLFLFRQLEKISEMSSWLAHADSKQADADLGSIVLSLVIPAVELTLVLPSNCPGQESMRDLDSAPLDTSSLQDMKLGSEATVAPSYQDRDSGVLASGNFNSLDASSLNQTPLKQNNNNVIQSGNFVNPNASFGNSSGNYDNQFDNFGTSMTQSIYSNQSQNIEVFLGHPLPAEEAPSPVMGFSGLSSMRRGLTSFMSSIDVALSRDDRASDAASTASSDSDKYVVVGLAAESPQDIQMAFTEFEQNRTGGGIEVAAEVIERSTSPSERSLTSECRRRDIISTCTFRINDLHLVHQSANRKSCMRLVADDLTTDECPGIPWDEFQSKFSMRARAWSEPDFQSADDTNSRDNSEIAVKMSRTELPRNDDSDLTTLPPFEEMLECRLHSLNVRLSASTAAALSELIQDEIIADPMPCEVLLKDIKLHLIDDRPSRSISSPPPQPMGVELTNVRLSRDKTGVIRLGQNVQKTTEEATRPSEDLIEAKDKVDRLKMENEELRKRLQTLSRIAEDNRTLRAKAEEAAVLRQCAHAAQQEAANLLRDKQELLDAVRMLQDQLSGGKR